MSKNETQMRSELDELLRNNGITHFRAVEVSQPSVHYSLNGQPTVNTVAPRKFWPNLVAVCKLAEEIRAAFGKPVIVLSGYRNPAYNKCIGGATHSYHMKGMALDIRVPGCTTRAVFEWMEKKYRRKYGRGLYARFVHIDVRPYYSRWFGGR